MTKYDHRTKSHHDHRRAKQPGNGGIVNFVAEAVDIEQAAHAVNYINRRKRRDNMERREAEKRTKITLPSLETLNKFMGR